MALAIVLAGVGVVHSKRVSKLRLEQAFVADVALHRAVVLAPVSACHLEQFFVGQLCSHQLFVIQHTHQKPVHRVFFFALHKRAVCLAIAVHDYVRKATGLVDLCFDCCLAFFRCFHLLVVVLELDFVFTLFGQLGPCKPF